MPFREFSVMAEAVFLPKRMSSQPFDLFLSNPRTMSFLACFGMATIIMTKFFHLGSGVHPSSLICYVILLNKCYISFVCHISDDFLIIEPASPPPPPPPPHTHKARRVRLACLACSSHSEILVSLWQITKPKAQTMS